MFSCDSTTCAIVSSCPFEIHINSSKYNFRSPKITLSLWPFVMSTIPSKFMLRKNLHQILLCQNIVTGVHNLCLPVTGDWRVCLIGSTNSSTPKRSFCSTSKQNQCKFFLSRFIIYCFQLLINVVVVFLQRKSK